MANGILVKLTDDLSFLELGNMPTSADGRGTGSFGHEHIPSYQNPFKLKPDIPILHDFTKRFSNNTFTVGIDPKKEAELTKAGKIDQLAEYCAAQYKAAGHFDQIKDVLFRKAKEFVNVSPLSQSQQDSAPQAEPKQILPDNRAECLQKLSGLYNRSKAARRLLNQMAQAGDAFVAEYCKPIRDVATNEVRRTQFAQDVRQFMRGGR